MIQLRRLVVVGAIAIGVLTARAVGAQTLRVQIPFAFIAAGHEFAPGDYSVTESDNGVVVVRSGVGKSAALISRPASAKLSSTSGLQFTKGEQHTYLSGVHVEGEPMRAIPVIVQGQRSLTISQ
jgi:hypothetical protein